MRIGWPCVLRYWMLLCTISCQSQTRMEKPQSPLVGRWVQVFPARGALDTLVLRADGTIQGSADGLDDTEFPLERWRIGAPLMRDGLCLGEAQQRSGARVPQFVCQAFVVTGDTMWLANRNHTVFLRYRTSDAVSAISPWPALIGAPLAPRPGQEPTTGSREAH